MMKKFLDYDGLVFLIAELNDRFASKNEAFTTEQRDKLDGVEEGAEKNRVKSVSGKTGDVELELKDIKVESSIEGVDSKDLESMTEDIYLTLKNLSLTDKDFAIAMEDLKSADKDIHLELETLKSSLQDAYLKLESLESADKDIYLSLADHEVKLDLKANKEDILSKEEIQTMIDESDVGDEGVVLSVNGKDGEVVLDSFDISFSDSESKTVGDYINSLRDKISIMQDNLPTKLSDLENDEGYLKAGLTWGDLLGK